MRVVGEWYLHRGKSCDLPVTPRHVVSAHELIALIMSPYDLKHGQCARVLSIKEGIREHTVTHYRQSCFLFHLVFPSGDHGLWPTPCGGSSVDASFHPAPSLYYRLPHEHSQNPAAYQMTLQGEGFIHFLQAWKQLHDGTSECIVQAYQTLFGIPFPLIAKDVDKPPVTPLPSRERHTTVVNE